MVYMTSPTELVNMISELFTLIVDYVKSQTLTPLKRLGRYLGFGIAGSIFMANGAIFMSLGILRYLQTLSALDNNLSFLPYVILAIFDLCVVGLLFFVASRPSLIKAK
jgi:hypothetical protein